ncbi:hypothetical protein K8P03_04560 [Anaerococcus murdochii]|uniref:Lipoprotein n=1 Tax=Anaerococcus murdochii TaxID=411577 RepID=A0ABS7SYF5_9FIRM|nr:hypothetical protein [Anaerococcus murdochii]MBZ2386568.1 hypothetical protein [Anaerococcus murdochii]
MFKKLVFGIIGIFIAIWAFILLTFRPTPGYLRNMEADGVKIEAQISNDDRKPIIRTYTKEEFETFDQAKIDNIEDDVDGRVEGDLPCIDLLKDNKIYISFYKDGKKVDPEKTHIEITAHASDYKDPTKTRHIEGELTEDGENTYSYATKRYGVQFEKYFMEYLQFEVTYTIDEKDYVSILGAFQSNVPDGTDFFRNEDLKEPLDPEE